MEVGGVEMLQFSPMLPPIAPGTKVAAMHDSVGNALRAPVWLPELQSVAVLDGGVQVLLPPAGGASALAPVAEAHALVGGSALATISSGTLRGVFIDPSSGNPQMVPLALEGAAAVGPVTFVAQVSEGRLLVGVDEGNGDCSVLCLRSYAPPLTLLTGVSGGVLGACVTDDERSLLLCTAGGVSRCSLDLADGRCSAPEALDAPTTAGHLSAIAADVAGNVYVSTGVCVCVCVCLCVRVCVSVCTRRRRPRCAMHGCQQPSPPLRAP